MPYCIQNFLMRNGMDLSKENMAKMKPYLDVNMKAILKDYEITEYERFCNKCTYEDIIDFPHGQMDHRKKIDFTDLEQHRFELFKSAFREFVEETGYTFFYSKYVKDAPLHVLKFKGGDDCTYTQIYFVLRNVYLISRDCQDPLFETILVPIQFAQKLFDIMQSFKVDGKNELLRTACSYFSSSN